MDGAYNERLFNKQTIRGKLHFARYYWLKQKIEKYCPRISSVVELGCFDGKTIDFLPATVLHFHGYDANWENGLDTAIENYKDQSKYQFYICDRLEHFKPRLEEYDISICMETLEHLPLKELELYIKKLHESTKDYCFVTVPNEKGVVLLGKYFIKKFFLHHVPEQYSNRDLFNGFMGRMDKIKRNEGMHKGFDYAELLKVLEKYFTVVEVNGVPCNAMSKKLNFTIGIVLKK